MKTTSGPITLERPKLRGKPEPFASRLLGLGVTRTKALESLVIAGFVRGLSVRDVEASLGEALREQAALSKSTVSRICQVLVDQFQLWQQRDLSDYELDYLFTDASFFGYHPAAKGEPILCTHGINTEGKKDFIALSAGAAGSFESWHAHLSDLQARGLRPPLLGVTDGNQALLSNLSAHRRPPLPSRAPRAGPPLEPLGADLRREPAPVKVIGRLPGEHSCLSLVWAVLDRASVGWRGIDTSVAGIRRLQDLGRQLLDRPSCAPPAEGRAATHDAARMGGAGTSTRRSWHTRRPRPGLLGRLSDSPSDHEQLRQPSRPTTHGTGACQALSRSGAHLASH